MLAASSLSLVTLPEAGATARSCASGTPVNVPIAADFRGTQRPRRWVAVAPERGAAQDRAFAFAGLRVFERGDLAISQPEPQRHGPGEIREEALSEPWVRPRDAVEGFS